MGLQNIISHFDTKIYNINMNIYLYITNTHIPRVKYILVIILKPTMLFGNAWLAMFKMKKLNELDTNKM